MVSLKKIFKRYKYFFLLASLFILGTSAKSFAAFDIDDSKLAWICVIGKTKCCVNGAKSCCEDNGTLYDTWSCDDSSCGASGRKEYKYTASGCSYTTSTRTCCYNGEWSAWDGVCPAAPKQCTGTRPESQTTCYGGKKRRTVTCNTSTGTWTTGSWGECDCSDSEFESVTTPSGGRCCQRKDGTGVRCAVGDLEATPKWLEMGAPCWNKVECGTGALPECNKSNEGTYWSKWISDNSWNSGCGSQYPYINGRGYCQQYMCR